ncbi:MAG TPA: 3-phosphoshikimate 1-carboxyvinyltransferase [Candidatus Hydrogenedentes bacterium]|nr:3-phosphoshikimate 1-carboxyvinyltransferase [Candidatus Hydrogenedentota bacterium]HQH52440.1 3-phosphoshikimate 1-carboxyvinyltransferase [Candidatus Hydrogenedentota bacterium]
MSMQVQEIRPRRNLNAVVSVPGSKSCTARALLMAALTRGVSTLTGTAQGDDAGYMSEGIRALGAELTREKDTVTVKVRRLTPPDTPLYLGNSGTAMRFLTAACASIPGKTVLDGSPRMRERPIEDLANALREWGLDAQTRNGCPPVSIVSTGPYGGTTHIRGSASSQYLSGLLMTAVLANRDAIILVEGELVSKPYVELTIAMMAERGIKTQDEGYSAFRVPCGQRYVPGTYAIEADASGASYFFAAAAIAGGRVRVRNLARASRQGDAQFPWALERMGCKVTAGLDWIEVAGADRLQGLEIDLNAMPDMAQTLAVTALFAEGPTTIRNVANLRIKECDRIEALTRELRKLGASVTEFGDGLRIVPGELRGAEIDTYDDHRMAMSFALAGLRVPGVVIKDPGCVSKTFPDFFDRFETLA